MMPNRNHSMFEKMVGTAKEDGDLYYFENGENVEKQATIAESVSSSTSIFPFASNKDVIMWHRRLGHLIFIIWSFCFLIYSSIKILIPLIVKFVNWPSTDVRHIPTITHKLKFFPHFSSKYYFIIHFWPKIELKQALRKLQVITYKTYHDTCL